MLKFQWGFYQAWVWDCHFVQLSWIFKEEKKLHKNDSSSSSSFYSLLCFFFVTSLLYLTYFTYLPSMWITRLTYWASWDEMGSMSFVLSLLVCSVGGPNGKEEMNEWMGWWKRRAWLGEAKKRRSYFLAKRNKGGEENEHFQKPTLPTSCSFCLAFRSSSLFSLSLTQAQSLTSWDRNVIAEPRLDSGQEEVAKNWSFALALALAKRNKTD